LSAAAGSATVSSVPIDDDRLARTLDAAVRGSGTILFLTGAGVSAESGIPTFRGKEGYWTVGAREYHPQELATRRAFGELPRDVWRWYLYRRGVCRNAAPNPAHRAIVELEKTLGDRFALVTQNVDGLHLRAGNTRERTFQIHGNIDFMRCARGCTPQIDELPPDLVLPDRDAELSDEDYDRLRCPRCAQPARPHVLWFDECYDEPLFRAQSAMIAASRADLLVIVGTSGATNLPIQIGVQVARRRRPIVDVNLDDGPFAELAAAVDGFCLRGPASRWIPTLVEALQTSAGSLG
jgi:NAD-dependent deacetylase